MLTEDQRNAVYVAGRERRARKYLIPFFGKKGLSEITGGVVNEYRMSRIEQSKERWGKPPARTTMHQEIMCLRQILKRPYAINGATHFLIFQSLTGRTARFRIVHGSRATSADTHL